MRNENEKKAETPTDRVEAILRGAAKAHPRAEWARIAAEEAASIDYDNFKDAVHDGTVRDDAYMEVWSDLRGAQDALDY
jgi:hypothetical protein